MLAAFSVVAAFIRLMRERPDAFVIPNLPDRDTADDYAWLADPVPAQEIDRLREVRAKQTPAGARGLRKDRLGTIAAGKSADFVVLDGNPLDDITNTRRIADVDLRGTRIDRPALAAAWTGGGSP